MYRKIMGAILTFVISLSCICGIAYATDETGETAPAITVTQDAEDTEKLTVAVTGSVTWEEIAAEISAEPEARAVTVQGKGENAVIALPEVNQLTSVSEIVSVDYDITFDNVKLQTTGYKQGSQTGTNSNGSYGFLFANGHRFYTTESVTTSGKVCVFGGSNGETAAEKRSVITGDTSVYLEGGNFYLVSGGSYVNAANYTTVDDAAQVSVTGTCNVYVGPKAMALAVVGGCVGGKNFGDINVTYASQTSGNVLIAGSSADASSFTGSMARNIHPSLAETENPNGDINITIEKNAVASAVHGTLYSQVSVKSVNITNNGTVDLITGTVGSDPRVNVKNSTDHYTYYGVYPGEDYYYEGSRITRTNYQVNANINITNNGTVTEKIEGAYDFTDLNGNITIIDNGTTDIIYGGGYFHVNVTGDVNVTENGTANEIYGGEGQGDWGTPNSVTGNIQVTLSETGTANVIFGGGLDNAVIGNVSVDVYGKVVQAEEKSKYQGNVFGGSYLCDGIGLEHTYVEGNTTVTIYPSATIAGNVYGGALDGQNFGDTKVYVNGTVEGDVYGGSWTQEDYKKYFLGYNDDGSYNLYDFGLVKGSTYVELGENAVANNVYGGGEMANVNGNCAVVLKDNASVQNVYGSGNPYTSFYYYGTLYTFSANTENVHGDATVTIQDSASVAEDIYGILTVEDDDAYMYYYANDASVSFLGATGSYKKVANTYLVQVTGHSDVKIDKEGTDNAQLVNVYDLTIDNGGKLTLLSDAEILGNYTGAEGTQIGTLAISAGKCLTVDGTVTNQTNLSILDVKDEDSTTTPQVEDVYVISGSGSTTDNGDYSWIDEREGLALAWKQVEATEATEETEGNAAYSQWWLVNCYSLTYNANGGTGSVTAQKGLEGNTVTVSKNGFTRVGYVFAGWNTAADGTGTDYQPENEFTFGTENVTLYAQWTKLGEITISPVSMEAYVGGDSANGSHAPKLRFSVTLPDGVRLNDLTFSMNTVNRDGTVKTETMDRERLDASKEDTLCLFPMLDANMNSKDNDADYFDEDATQVQRGDYLKLVDAVKDSTTYAGKYTIETRSGYGTDWYITATDGAGKVYQVNLDTNQATVTIREVSAETNETGTSQVEIYETPTKYLTTVVTDVMAVTASEKAEGQGFIAVAKADTTFLTNAKASLGLFGENADDTNVYVDKANAKVALLVDDTVALKDGVTVEELESAMLTYAKAAAEDEDSTLSLKVPMTSVQYDFKYLDLVNAADGNAWVSTDQPVTIYWPYPDGIRVDNADAYTFQILHFNGLDRSYVVGVSNGTLDVGSDQVTVENVPVTATEYGLKFETSSFSPFVLLWAEKCTLSIDYLCTSGESVPNAVTIETYAGATVSIADIEELLGNTPWTDHTYANSLYYERDMKERIGNNVTLIPVTGNMTIYAGYTHQSGSIGSAGDNSTPTTKYTLTYVPNNGTDSWAETYEAGTVVTLDKLPTREGYTFRGWYADEALTQKAETVTMNQDITVYAGWQASTVPEMLSGESHFAYIVGYEDGTVRPGGNITRAEVATIFFRLLKDDIRDGNLTSENPFEDVPENAWYCKAVSTLTALGIIEGRSETSFAPNEPITRAELATICARFDTGVTSGTSTFTDIAGHWAEAEIQRAAALGWVEGYDEDGTFRPDRNITRAEAITMINRVLCRIPKDESDLIEDMNTWPDNRNTDAWYYLAVQEATNSHEFRHKGEVSETWTQMQEDPDWERYEK